VPSNVLDVEEDVVESVYAEIDSNEWCNCVSEENWCRPWFLSTLDSIVNRNL